MAFTDLTWTAGFWNEETQSNVGFESQWEASNGYLLCVRTELPGTGGTIPATATGAGQLYDCEVYSWDRAENSEAVAVSSEYGVDATRVEAIMGEVNAIALPEVEETTTTTTTAAPGPSPQWD